MDLTRSYSIRPPQAPNGPSLALAVAVTGAMLAMAFLAGTSVSHRWWDRDVTPPRAERITFVAPPPVPVTPTVPRTPAAPVAPGPVEVRPASPAVSPAGGTQVVAPTVAAPRVAPFPAPGLPVDTGVAARRGAGPAGAGAAAGVRGPTQSPMPLRVGAELPAAPPLTRTQKDSVLRAFTRQVFGNPAVQAAAVAAAADAQARRDDEARRQLGRSAGGGASVVHGVPIVSIKFGGPSAEQRRRDSVVDADTRARLAHAADQRARQIADSVRRDSLRTLADSAHFIRRPED